MYWGRDPGSLKEGEKRLTDFLEGCGGKAWAGDQ